MNNRSWFKLQYALLDDTRLKAIGAQFGIHEATSLYTRLLVKHYDEFPNGIPWGNDLIRPLIAEYCQFDEESIEAFVSLACDPDIDFFSLTAWTEFRKITSSGVLKETGALKDAQTAGSEGGKTNTKPKPKPKP